MTGYVHPQFHAEVKADLEAKLVEACNEIAFWKTAAQRAIEILSAREEVQEQLRRRALDICRLCKLWAMDQDTTAWREADALEKELQLEDGPLEASCGQ